MISLLVAGNLIAQASCALSDVLRVASPPVSAVRRLADRFKETEKHLDFKAALLVDRAFAIDNFRQILGGNQGGGQSGPGWPTAILFKRDGENYLNRMERILSALDQPYFEARDSIGEAVTVSSWTPFSKLLLPMHRSNFDSYNRLIARMRQAAIACFVAAERVEGKALPEDLNALAPETSVDPFTGKPFIVRIEGEAILLISPGQDGIDAGLSPASFKDEEPDPDDWQDDVFFYLPPPLIEE